MKTVWMLAAAGALVSSAAMAQGPGTDSTIHPDQAETVQVHPGQAAQSQTGQSQTGQSQAMQSPTGQGGHVQQRVASDLTKAGFSDVRVMPDAFLVTAKDKSGQPITMMINPNSVTEFIASAGGSNAQGQTGGQPSAASGPAFETLPPAEELSTKVVGLDVHNNANQDIGTIKDIAYDGSRIKAYIVGVGGFLGMGDRYVAVSPSALHVTYDHNAKTWHAELNANADQLKAAPAYNYGNAG